MVTELFTEKRTQVQNWMWRQRFERAHGEQAGLMGNGRKLNLLLGVSGSGVEHLARMFSLPGIKLRYYNSPAAKLEPEILLSKSGDPLAVPYLRNIDRLHPLSRFYRMLVEKEVARAKQRPRNRRDEAQTGPLTCLVKESHSLLATESLLDFLKTNALLYLGDPVRTVDRLLEQQGLDTSYLEIEGRSVLAPYFLSRFLRQNYVPVIKGYKKVRHTPDARKRTILHRVLIVALIQHMFRMLAARYPRQAILIESDQLERNPQLLTNLLQRLMGEEGEAISHKMLEAATIVPLGKEEAIWKDAWPDRGADFGFLTDKEADSCYRLLRRTGLGMESAVQTEAPSQKRSVLIHGGFRKTGNG